LLLHASDEAFLLMSGFTGQVFLLHDSYRQKSTGFFFSRHVSINYQLLHVRRLVGIESNRYSYSIHNMNILSI
jgi:hypothetical protein